MAVCLCRQKQLHITTTATIPATPTATTTAATQYTGMTGNINEAVKQM